jgi:uncharacterized membrane protein YdjX (TVP38/TMEM64 family)
MVAVGRPWARLGALLGLLTVGVVLTRATGLDHMFRDPEARAHSVESLRGVARIWWVGPAYAAAYAVLVAFALPASALTLMGGAAFGLLRGVLWVTVGANLGASLAFVVARRLGRTALQGFFGQRLAAFDRITGAAGFQGLLTLRLLPLAPFNLLNYAAGLTAIPWRDYVFATAIGILPGTVVYVFFADALLSGSTEASHRAYGRVFLAGGLLVAFSLLSKWLTHKRSASSQSLSPP